MINSKQAFVNFGIITVSLWPLILTWIAAVFLLGLIHSTFANLPFSDSTYLAFSTSLSLGSPDLSMFQGGFRMIELVLDVLGVILWGITASITMKAIEGAYDE